MPYTTETEIYDRTGMSSENIRNLSGKSITQVTTLIAGYITDAQRKIRDDIGYPIVITEELHLGDGEKNQFKLGPQDENYMTLGDYDPTDNLVKVYRAKFSSAKKHLPFPEDCDKWAEGNLDEWTGTNVTITDEETIKKCGSYGIKAVFSAAGYIQFPDNSDKAYLDKIIDLFPDFFTWLRLSNSGITITLRFYDKDGNCNEQELTLRQNNIGQYVWVNIDSMSGSVNWENTELQYFRLYVDGACDLYIDNICFADEWAFTEPEGLFHVSVADNVTSESPPSENYPFYVTYGYDPFLASVPGNVAEAAEWLCGVYIIDYLRGIRMRQTSFEVFGDTLELDQDSSREGLLGVRTYFMKSYWRCLRNWGGASYGVIM